MTGDSQRDIPKSGDPVTAQMTVCDQFGDCDTVSSRLPIEFVSISRKKRERRGNLAIDRYRLPLFAYGNDELLVAQKDIVDRFVKPEVDELTSIEVSAFTDRKGPGALNLTLSERRAQQIDQLLPPIGTKLVRGYGEGTEDVTPPFSNTTPEGRLYNRTVEVVLIKKYE
jgi:outer membrane protein OmpA-like peptidoglycan-associated protein